jgi:photosystem II stability/assembly factor-like uncharacterized protein
MVIWSALGYSGWAVGWGGTILRTYGGGQEWITQTAGVVDFYGVHGRPNNHRLGVSVGADGDAFGTYDTGEDWLPLSFGTTALLTSVYFSSDNIVWVVGESGYTFRTGTTPAYVVAEVLWDVYALDDQTAWAVGEGGRIISTTNGASTWSSDYLFGVFAVDDQTAWTVGENGTILHTANSGTTWITQTSSTSEYLFGVFAVDDQTAWAVGGSGTILHTTDGGTTWTAQTSGTAELLLDIFFAYPDRYGGDNWQGTSMSAPAVSGILGLMLEAYNTTYGTDPWPSTLKAILMHTAEDLGNAGPDYKFGYGHVDALAAVNLIADTTYFTQGSVDNGIVYTYTLTSDGAVAPMCTLVWDDVPANPAADPALVNDLDLRLVAPNGTTHMPWVLDKDNPDNAATRGDNGLDNVEQVVATATQAGGWSVVVIGDSVPLGPQGFSLVCNSALTSKTNIYLPVVLSNHDPSQLLRNGDFDTGTLTPWQIYIGSPALTDQVYRSAPYSLRLAGSNDAEDVVYQEVTVPSNATGVTLDFWYRASSNDPSAPEDHMCVDILDTNADPVAGGSACYDLYYVEPKEQWLPGQLVITGADLTPLLGQTGAVSFSGWTNATNPSTAWVDDVSFKVTTP